MSRVLLKITVMLASCWAIGQEAKPAHEWTYSGDEGPALQARMGQNVGQQTDPGGRLAYDQAGNLYFADTANDLIRMIDTGGIVHRVAGVTPVDGVPQAGYSGDNGSATSAELNHPIDIAFADDGTMYVTDVYNHCVRAVAPDQTITTVAGKCGTKGFSGDDGPATPALPTRMSSLPKRS